MVVDGGTGGNDVNEDNAGFGGITGRKRTTTREGRRQVRRSQEKQFCFVFNIHGDRAFFLIPGNKVDRSGWLRRENVRSYLSNPRPLSLLSLRSKVFTTKGNLTWPVQHHFD